MGSRYKVLGLQPRLDKGMWAERFMSASSRARIRGSELWPLDNKVGRPGL